MANMYYETAWFAGPADQMRSLGEVLRTELIDGTKFIELHIQDQMLVRGWDATCAETPTSISISAQMRWDPLGAFFGEISEAVPGLFMASTSHCVFDNRHLLIAGVGEVCYFVAEPPVFTDDWEQIPGISDSEPFILDIVRHGLSAALRAAEKSFSRGKRFPRKAAELLKETANAYKAADPPPNVDWSAYNALVGRDD